MLDIPFHRPPQPEIIEISSWPRADHFAFYCGFAEPFWSITTEVICTEVVRSAKAAKRSVTLHLWHRILQAVNELDAFKLRISEGQPVRYSRIHLSPTVMREDGTFTITFLPYLDDFEEFEKVAGGVLEQARLSQGFKLDAAARRIDLVHFSTIPWFGFSSLSHARHMGHEESEPKITIGRFAEVNGQTRLPISITVHHGLADGVNVAQLLERLQALFAQPVF